MLDVTTMYGPVGPDTVGDSHVADILKRTVEGQPDAVHAFDVRIAALLSTGALVTTDLPTMVAAHSEWLAAILWQMASCYLDGTVTAFASDNDTSFAATAYPGGDTLCDAARLWSRKAVETRSLIDNKGKVHLTQVMTLPQLSSNAYTMRGVWAAYDLVTYQVASDTGLFAARSGIPVRFQPLYSDITKQVQPHVQAMRELRKDFYATTIATNAIDILNEALHHVQELFLLGQYMWAPFLLGPKYTEAMRRQLSLDELGLGFDPWIMTDPLQRKKFEKDVSAREELAQFWSTVPDPHALHALAEQVNNLRTQDSLRRRYGRGYPSAPWPSQFMVRRRVSLCGRMFEPGDLIGYFVRLQVPTGTAVDVRRTGRATGPIQLLGRISE